MRNDDQTKLKPSRTKHVLSSGALSTTHISEHSAKQKTCCPAKSQTSAPSWAERLTTCDLQVKTRKKNCLMEQHAENIMRLSTKHQTKHFVPKKKRTSWCAKTTPTPHYHDKPTIQPPLCKLASPLYLTFAPRSSDGTQQPCQKPMRNLENTNSDTQ